MSFLQHQMANENMLRSEAEIVQNSALVTTAGASLASSDLLGALQQRELKMRDCATGPYSHGGQFANGTSC